MIRNIAQGCAPEDFGREPRQRFLLPPASPSRRLNDPVLEPPEQARLASANPFQDIPCQVPPVGARLDDLDRFLRMGGRK